MKRFLLVALTVCLLNGATPAVAQTAPLSGNPRSASGALARGTALATSFPLPQDLTWTTKAARLTSRTDVQATDTVVVRRRARGAHGAVGLLEFLRTHPPAGMVFSDASFSPVNGLIEYTTNPRTDTSAELQYTLHGAAVELELDISVGWTPARPTDTVLPRGLKAVTVEVGPAQDLGGPTATPTFGHQVIHATGPAVASLVHYLDGLSVAGPFPYGAGACTRPLFYGSDPRFTFRTPHHVVVFQYVNNCQTFNVSVDGKHRPALDATSTRVDPTRLVMTQLLHLVP